jgi:hypothetical protein
MIINLQSTIFNPQLSSQHLTHFSGNRIPSERLLEERRARVQHAVVQNRVIRAT